MQAGQESHVTRPSLPTRVMFTKLFLRKIIYHLYQTEIRKKIVNGRPRGAQVPVWVRPLGRVLVWPLLLLSRILSALAKAVPAALGDVPSVGATILGTQQGMAPKACARDAYTEVETKGNPTCRQR